jgi:hypothetical protein
MSKTEIYNKSAALKRCSGYPEFLAYLDQNYGRLLESYPLPKTEPVKGEGNYQTIEPEDINPKTRIPISRYH